MPVGRVTAQPLVQPQSTAGVAQIPMRSATRAVAPRQLSSPVARENAVSAARKGELSRVWYKQHPEIQQGFEKYFSEPYQAPKTYGEWASQMRGMVYERPKTYQAYHGPSSANPRFTNYQAQTPVQYQGIMADRERAQRAQAMRESDNRVSPMPLGASQANQAIPQGMAYGNAPPPSPRPLHNPIADTPYLPGVGNGYYR